MISCIVIVLKIFSKIKKFKRKGREGKINQKKFYLLKLNLKKNIGTDVITQFWIPKYCSIQNVYFLI